MDNDEVDIDELEEGAPEEVVYEVIDDEDDDELEEELEAEEEEEERAEEETEAAAEEIRKRGRSDRAFFDDLAKNADASRQGLDKSIQATTLSINDLRAKLTRKERELKEVMEKIKDARAREELLTQREYRKKGLLGENEALRSRDDANTGGVSSTSGILGNKPLDAIEVREVTESLSESEREKAVLVNTLKELAPQKELLETEARSLTEAISERERALSLMRHNRERAV